MVPRANRSSSATNAFVIKLSRIKWHNWITQKESGHTIIFSKIGLTFRLFDEFSLKPTSLFFFQDAVLWDKEQTSNSRSNMLQAKGLICSKSRSRAPIHGAGSLRAILQAKYILMPPVAIQSYRSMLMSVSNQSACGAISLSNHVTLFAAWPISLQPPSS